MNLTLTRFENRSDGIFSLLSDEDGNEVARTVEHSYCANGDDCKPPIWEPKIPVGEYVCVRGKHILHGGPFFETFEITGVAGHTGLLFHCGNHNSDSEGCVCVGEDVVVDAAGFKEVTNSRATFKKFMALQGDLDAFMLTVK